MPFWRKARALRRIVESDASRQIFERTGEVDALHNAVASARHAVDLAPPGSPMAPVAASLLSRALRLTFEETRDDDVLREAVTLADRAVSGIAEGDANWSSFHYEVAIVRRAAFERSTNRAARSAGAPRPPVFRSCMRSASSAVDGTMVPCLGEAADLKALETSVRATTML